MGHDRYMGEEEWPGCRQMQPTPLTLSVSMFPEAQPSSRGLVSLHSELPWAAY